MKDEKLKKIVALAKRGEGGEKKNAIAAVKRICEQEGLSFDDVMSDRAEKKERRIICTEADHLMCGSVVARYGVDDWDDLRSISLYSHPVVRSKVLLVWWATDEQYVDTLNAWEILRRAYRKELRELKDRLKRERENSLKSLDLAFRMSNNLFYQGERPEDSEMPNVMDDENAGQAMRMARGMKAVPIHRALENPDNKKS